MGHLISELEKIKPYLGNQIKPKEICFVLNSKFSYSKIIAIKEPNILLVKPGIEIAVENLDFTGSKKPLEKNLVGKPIKIILHNPYKNKDVFSAEVFFKDKVQLNNEFIKRVQKASLKEIR